MDNSQQSFYIKPFRMNKRQPYCHNYEIAFTPQPILYKTLLVVNSIY